MTNSGEEMIKVNIGEIFLTKSKYHKSEKLAKEFGMVDMRQYRDYCMDAILESHYPDQE